MNFASMQIFNHKKIPIITKKQLDKRIQNNNSLKCSKGKLVHVFLLVHTNFL